MRTITKQINLYTFEELSETAKETALNNYLEHLDFQSDYVIENFIIENFQTGHNLPTDVFKYVYSGFHSQGDGGRFEFKTLQGVDLKPFVKHVFKTTDKRYKSLMYAINEGHIVVCFNLNGFGYHYLHEQGFYLDCECYADKKEELFNRFTDELQDYFKELSLKLYAELKEYYEYETSEECFKELCDMNEYTFLESGEVTN